MIFFVTSVLRGSTLTLSHAFNYIRTLVEGLLYASLYKKVSH